MSRIDGLGYSVKILNNKIYWGFVVNWAIEFKNWNIYLRMVARLFKGPDPDTNITIRKDQPLGSGDAK